MFVTVICNEEWTARTLTESVLEQYRKSKLRTITIGIERAKPFENEQDSKLHVSFDATTYILSEKKGMKVLGESILRLSRTSRFDKVWRVTVPSQLDLFRFMIPLTHSKEAVVMRMTSPISGGIQHIETFRIFCKMIRKNKMESVNLRIAS